MLTEPSSAMVLQNAQKLAGKVTGTAAPAMWGPDLQVSLCASPSHSQCETRL